MSDQFKILIVDDEEDLSEILADVFGDDENIGEVINALSGEDAFEIVKSRIEEIDAVVSDERMGGMSGQELLANIMKLSSSNNPLFYLLTGDIDITDEDVISIGGNGVIAKPYDVFEVVETVVKALKEKQSK